MATTFTPTITNIQIVNGLFTLTLTTAVETPGLPVGYIRVAATFNNSTLWDYGTGAFLTELTPGTGRVVALDSATTSAILNGTAGQSGNIVVTLQSTDAADNNVTEGSPSAPYYYSFVSQNPPCFLADAPVLTPAGYKPIASLREGDLVTTADGRAVAIERVSVTRVPAPNAAVNPYVIKKGQFGATERLLISPRHRVAVPGKGMVEARELGLRQKEMTGAFDYYNLELPSWKSDNMVVAGVEVESLAPVRRMVVSAEQLKSLLAGKTLDAATVARLRSVIRPVAGGFEVPLIKKSAAK